MSTNPGLRYVLLIWIADIPVPWPGPACGGGFHEGSGDCFFASSDFTIHSKLELRKGFSR
jgi:hypothetical protein